MDHKGHVFIGESCTKCGMDRPESGEWFPTCDIVQGKYEKVVQHDDSPTVGGPGFDDAGYGS